MPRFHVWPWSCLLVSVLACSEDPPVAPDVQLSGAPIALEHQLLFVDGTNQDAYLLDVADAKSADKARRIELPPSAAVFERRRGADHDEALVLCAGRRADSDVEAVPATLVRIKNTGEAVRITLGTTPFNALKQSDDGRYAIMFRTGGADGRILDNPNELVVVDLDAATEDSAEGVRKTPDGLGHTLTDVIVSPTLRIAGEDRRLLVVLSASEVTLFDLGHLDRRATIVQLDETRQIDPKQVVFSQSNPTLYVRAQSSDNIFMFRLEPHENDALGNDFRPTVNPLSGGVGPRDIALFGSGADERLIVVAEQSAQVLVIDPSSSKTNTLKLRYPAQHILLFDGPSPADASSRTRALLYGDQLGVSFVEPQDLGDSPEDKLETVAITAPISAVLPLLDDRKVVLLQNKGVTVLDLAERTLTPISASNELKASGSLFDAERKRLWVGPEYQLWLGTLDLSSGTTGEIRLDAPTKYLIPLFDQARLAVVHEPGTGAVTLIDLEQPDREHIVSLHDIF